MNIDLSELNPTDVYFTLTQAVIPRPIAWVLSRNPGEDYNLAPFSYFNAVCSEPPLIILSLGRKPDGSAKDTQVNIEARRDFVVHIAHRQMLDSLNSSSATLPAGESEVSRLGLELVDFPGSSLPRLADCRLALACELYAKQEIGHAGQSLLFGLVRRLYADDSIAEQRANGRMKIHADRLAPLGRLGASEYMEFGKVISLSRPK